MRRSPSRRPSRSLKRRLRTPSTSPRFLSRVRNSSRISKSNIKRLLFAAFEGSGSSTQTQTQGSTQSNNGGNSVYQKLVKRVTRFWTDAAYEAATTHVRGVCQKLGYKVETKAPGQVDRLS